MKQVESPILYVCNSLELQALVVVEVEVDGMIFAGVVTVMIFHGVVVDLSDVDLIT